MKRFLLMISLLAVAATAVGQGVQGQLNSIFDDMTSHSDPKAFMGARRGVVSLGSFTSRTPVVNERLLTVTKPSFRTGSCGAIDAYMGAFSVISKDQAVQALRAIGSAAKSYAYRIAISAVSPMITSALSQVEERLSSLTDMNINSCEIVGNQLGGDALVQRASDWGSSVASSMFGGSSDAAGSRPNVTGQAAEQTLYDRNPEAVRQEITGNFVWRAVSVAEASRWFTGGDDSLKEQLVSVTGTVVTCIPGKDSCPIQLSGEEAIPGAVQTIELGPILRLDDLVFGSRGSAGGSERKVKIYRCMSGNGPNECLDMRPFDDQSIQGLLPRFRRVLLGENNRPGEGLLGRYRHNVGTPTAEEAGVVNALGPAGAWILELTARDETLARMYAEQYLPAFCTEIAYQMLDQMMHSVQLSIGTTGADHTGRVYEMVERARSQLAEDRQFSRNRVDTFVTLARSYRDYASVTKDDTVDLSGAALR
jgi:conjugative transfer pilus assembly protein TraH